MSLISYNPRGHKFIRETPRPEGKKRKQEKRHWYSGKLTLPELWDRVNPGYEDPEYVMRSHGKALYHWGRGYISW